MNPLIDLRAAPTQTLEIWAAGRAVANLGPPLLTPDFVEQAALPANLEGLLAISDAEVAALPVPDVVALFALAVSEGFFGSVGVAPAGARSSTHYDGNTSTRVWILDVTDMPPRALRVLLGLLDGLDADSIALQTTTAIAAHAFDAESNEWPEPPTECPFHLELQDIEALEEAGTLCVRFEASRALSDDERAIVERGFDIWTNILMMGGYLDRPLHGVPPVGLEPGGWEDDHTFVQQFDVFRCVPEAIHPLLHFTNRLAQAIQVRQLDIHA